MARAVAVALVLLVCAPAWAEDRPGAARRAASYLVSRQQDNGAFGSGSQPADATAEYVAALAAAGGHGPAIDRGLDHIRLKGPHAPQRAGNTARIVMGVVAGGADPRRFGDTDYVAGLGSFYDPATGAYETGNLYSNSLAILALTAAGVEVPARARTYMRANQCATGGWSHAPACAQSADTDTTAMAVSAMRADDASASRAREWLVGAQRADGGWGIFADKATNANSTALAVSAVIALGEDPDSWHRNGHSGPDALAALQLADGGFRYTADETRANDYSTVQALVAVAGFAYPVPARSEVDAQPAPAPRVSQPATSVGAPPRQAPSADARRRARVEAGLAVRTPGWTDDRCLELDEPSNGYDLLTASGLSVEVQPFGQGAFVCSVDGTGCGVRSCTDCEPETFWGYWTREPGEDGWTFSEVGMTERVLADGSADAWVWGRDGGPAPSDDVDAATICASSVPVPTPEGPSAEQGDRSRSSGPIAVAGLLTLVAASAVALGINRRPGA